MIAVEIENIKRFMAGFLGGDLFDDFLMNEGKLSMDIAYEFNGKVLKEFYDTEEWEKYGTYPYIPWEREKSRMFALIKGKKTPLGFQFVMMLKPEKVGCWFKSPHSCIGRARPWAQRCNDWLARRCLT